MVKLKRIVLLCAVLLPAVAPAQSISVTPASGSIEAFIRNHLVGEGVYVWNIKFNNSTAATFPNGNQQIGTFQSNGYPLLQMDSGVVMTTGEVTFASPSSSYSSGASSAESPAQYSDPVMASWGNTTRTVNDCATLDFDFVSISPFVTVNYCFGSKEYTSYVCSSFNDIFGFIVEGPYPSNNRWNTAIIPHTVSYAHPQGIEVAINTVNSGSCSGNYSAGEGTYLIYSDFYVANPTFSGVRYDGFTQKLSANATLLPCERYHMHLSVCDVSDHSFDSGVFLEKKSFNSPSADVNLSHRYADTIERSVGTVLPLTLAETDYVQGNVTASFGGTAVVGRDYTIVTDSGYTVNEMNPTFNVSTANNTLTFRGTPAADLAEPKLIEVYLMTSLCRHYPALKTYDTIRYILVEDDVVRLRHDTIVAYDTCRQVGVEVAVGRPPFTFHWEPETGIDFPYQQYSTASITESRNYRVSVADTRGHTDTADIYVKVLPRTNGIEERPKADVSIYPNPAEDQMNVVADGITTVEVFDAQGRRVYRSAPVTGKARLDVKPLPAGLYTVRVVTNIGIKTEKVIVR